MYRKVLLFQGLPPSCFLYSRYQGDDAFFPGAEHTKSILNLIMHLYNTVLGCMPEPWAVDTSQEGHFNYAYILQTSLSG